MLVPFRTVGGTGSDRERAKLAEGVRTQNQMILVHSANEKCAPHPRVLGTTTRRNANLACFWPGATVCTRAGTAAP